MKFHVTSFLSLSILCFFYAEIYAFAAADEAKIHAVTTFECIGIYYPSQNHGECEVRYRESGADNWQTALSRWRDARNQEYRGSNIGLKPDTNYEIRLRSEEKQIEFQTRTKTDRVPIGKVTYLPDGVLNEPITIRESGAPDAYLLITPAEGAKTTIDVINAADCTAITDADYVILRGIELKNAARHGISIERGRHDIVVEDYCVTFWDRIGGPLSFGNEGGSNSSIFAQGGAGNLTIQRNLLEHPRGRPSNDWDTGHPNEP
ncbi:MAG: hypothetical protein C4527_17615 [Candidatus Omnitrophota bacterium]|nr:MAG: hypothetical protein C4527_17615 [Candidatus Omnitrophota bacterium]